MADFDFGGFDVNELIGGFNEPSQSFGGVASSIPSSDFSLGVSAPLNLGGAMLPSTPETKPDTSGGWGFGDIAKTVGGFAKSALPIAQLGGAGLGIGLGIKGAQQGAEQTKIAKQAEKRQGQIAEKAEAMAQPLSAFSQQQLTQAGAGKIDPAQEAMIQQWVQGAKQKVQDLFARTGQGDSLQLQNELAWIDQMAQGMRMQAITAEEQSAISASGTAGNILGTGAQAASGAGGAAQQSGSSIAALIKQANEALGTLAGSSA